MYFSFRKVYSKYIQNNDSNMMVNSLMATAHNNCFILTAICFSEYHILNIPTILVPTRELSFNVLQPS